MGRRFGIMPLGMGRICWYATRNGPPSDAGSPGGRKEELQGLFEGWHDPIQALIAATNPDDIIKHDARDRKPLRHWGDRRVTLLGDAAHPITPNVGQGACLAIEDAACLVKCLLGNPQVPAALRCYETMRKSRTAHITLQARRIGAIGQWENPLVVKGRNFFTRLILARSPDMQLNTLYAYEV
jgi:2-polyprenyl-6-methoxyphenol hydroxylase-like FAD-dependent oxidoreductase